MENPKSIEELVLADANLGCDGLAAFDEKNFPKCIELLNKALDREKDNWQARLVLAIAYYNTGDIFTGAIHFRYLNEHCPTAEIRAQSAASLQAMDQELKMAPKLNAPRKFWGQNY